MKFSLSIVSIEFFITFITKIKFRNNSKSEYSPLEATPGINVPTLLIHGKNDPIFPYEHASLLKEKIRKSKIWIPDEADHSSIEDNPDYSSRVIGFIESI